MECEMFLDLILPSFLSSSLEMNYLAAGLRASTFSGTFSDILIHFYQKMNENGKHVLFIMEGREKETEKLGESLESWWKDRIRLSISTG